MKILENIFSVKNDYNSYHKVITIGKFKFKFKTKKMVRFQCSKEKGIHSLNKKRITLLQEPEWVHVLRNAGYIIDNENKIYKEPSGVLFDNINHGLLEVFYNKDYEISFNKQSILIDIGLNIGMTTLFFAQKEKINKVYSFEPFIPTYCLAIKNIEKNPLLKSKIETFNYGLDNEDKEFEMPYSSAVSGCMSTSFNPFEINSRICQNVEQIEKIKVKRASNILKPIIKNHTINNEMIILKIDTEGAEFSILEDLNKNDVLQYVDVIILEYHFKSPKQLEDILLKNNFLVRYAPPIIKEVGMIFAHKIGA